MKIVFSEKSAGFVFYQIAIITILLAVFGVFFVGASMNFPGSGSAFKNEYYDHSIKLSAEVYPDSEGLIIRTGKIEVPEPYGEYQLLSFEGSGHMNEVGKAQVPVIRKLIAIPPDSDPSVEIIGKKCRTEFGYNVFPVQEETFDGHEEVFFKDEIFYSQDEFYPAGDFSLGKPGVFRDYRVILIDIYPIRFNPVKKELEICEDMEVKIDFKTKSGLSASSLGEQQKGGRFDPIYRKSIFNYDIRPVSISYYSRTLDDEDSVIAPFFLGDNLTDTSNEADYLIITYDNTSADLDIFKTWKESKSLEVEIVNLSQVYSEFPGDNDTTIRDFLNYTYNNWTISPTYVLLIGDYDQIPLHEYTPSWTVSETEDASDYYYTLLDGDDLYPEMIIGRFSLDATNSTLLGTVINKSIDFDQNPPAGAWRKNLLLVAHSEDAPGKYQGCSEEIDNYYLEGKDYTVNKVYPYEGGVAQDAINIINSGASIVNYRGHGSATSWSEPIVDVSDAYSFTNGDMSSIVFSIACSNAEIDYGSESLGEAWLSSSGGGAVAFLGATRLSPTTRNHYFDKAIFNNAFNGSNYTLGDLITQAKVDVINYYGGSDNSARGLVRIYVLLGDPDVSIFQPLQVDHDILVDSIEVPILMEVDNNVTINTSLKNVGIFNESNINLTFRINGIDKNTTMIDYLNTSEPFNVSFIWNASYPNTWINITMNLTFVNNENITKNNEYTVKRVVLGKQQEGWPQEAMNILDSHMAIFDIDNDTYKEVIAGDQSGWRYAWYHNGSTMGGWPKFTAAFPFASAAVGDIDNDSTNEIVFSALRSENVFAYEMNGSYVSGFPRYTNYGLPTPEFRPSIVLEDINNDTVLDIIAMHHTYVHVWYYNGTGFDNVTGFPVKPGAGVGRIAAAPAVADIDKDGNKEIVIGAESDVYVINYTGGVLSGWPKDCSIYYSSIMIAELDNNTETLEIITANSDNVYAWYPNATSVWQTALSYGETGSSTRYGSVGDVTGDGLPEVFYCGGILYGTTEGKLFGFYHNGTALDNFPIATDMPCSGDPVLADINSDNETDIIMVTSDYYMHAWHANGSEISGYPISTSERVNFIGTPTVGDLDRDGDLEIVLGSGYRTYIYDTDEFYLPATIKWGKYQGDIKNTGFYSEPQNITVECNDGADNDGDGLIDYGNDPQCNAPYDCTEQTGDPPVTLPVSPPDNETTSNVTVYFNCSATDDAGLSSITLYGNWSGWHANESISVSGLSNSTYFSKNIQDGTYVWNCLSNDTDTNIDWGDSNRTISIDTVSPKLDIMHPENTTYNSSPSLNFSYTENNTDSCWYNLNGTGNVTLASCDTNGTAMVSGEGSNNVILYINDSAGNENSSTVYWTLDTTPPDMTIDSPENRSYSTTWLWANLTLNENTSWCGYSLNGSGNVSMDNDSMTHFYHNMSGLGESQYNIAFSCNDTMGNMNTTAVLYFTIDKAKPVISNVTNGTPDWNSMNISWETDKPSNSSVSYGTNQNNLSLSKTDSLFTISHKVNLTGLSGNTTYYYNVSSCDSVGNCNQSGTYNFTTLLCIEDWSYSEWSSCSGGTQTRTATDLNGCGTTLNRGALSQSCSTGSSGGGGGGTVSMEAPSLSHTWAEINPDVIARMSIGKEGVSLTGIDFRVKSMVRNAEIALEMLDAKPGETGEIAGGKVYQYIRIEHTDNLNGTDIRSATIRFRVNRTWISENNINKSGISLNRYTKRWDRLSTTFQYEDTNYSYYQAETPGLSYFAISGEEAVRLCNPNEKRCLENMLQQCSSRGEWIPLYICEHGCSGGACISGEGLCTPGETRCLENKLLTCSPDGEGWLFRAFCSYGCSEGKCIEDENWIIILVFAIAIVIAIILVIFLYYHSKKREFRSISTRIYFFIFLLIRKATTNHRMTIRDAMRNSMKSPFT